MQMLLEARSRRNLDKFLLLAIAGLMLFSLIAIFEADGIGRTIRQGVYFVVGIGLMAFIASQDYRQIPRLSLILYTVNCLLLLVVLFTEAKNGSQRWIQLPIPGMDFKLQPSEFAKIAIIITLSDFVYKLGPQIKTLRGIFFSLGHVAIPVALIMKQPDLGTSLVFLAIWAGIVFLAGARWQHLIGLLVVGIGLFAFAWQFNILHDYQKQRIDTVLNPGADPQGKGYQVAQSLRAIGGGQTIGQGLGQGIQTNGDFVPENHTDFIFTVVGEETGFFGACILLSLYALLLYRGIVNIAECEDGLGRLIIGGVVTLFAFHMAVNIGMTCGIAPVVGVPLPLVSFGGSAAWANLMALGLLIGINIRRYKLQF